MTSNTCSSGRGGGGGRQGACAPLFFCFGKLNFLGEPSFI